MPSPRRASPYPWSTLERVPRGVARRLGSLRRAIERGARLEQLGPALGELLTSDVTIVLRDVSLGSELAQPCRIGLEWADGSARAVIGLEPALATAALGRLLGRGVGVGPANAPLDPSLSGALASLVVEAARRAGAELPLRVSPPGASREPGMKVAATVVLDGRPYEAGALLWSQPMSEPALAVSALDGLPIELGLIVAQATIARGELGLLTPGDAWLAGPGWWIDRRLSGRGVLAAPGGESGVVVELSAEGSMVVRGVEHGLGVEVETMADEVSQAAAQAALDAPVVVRVELGSVSMTAREWASLGAGDVIETGRRVASPVVLRVGGQVVARGDLVDVEGELGVRIRELVTQGEPK